MDNQYFDARKKGILVQLFFQVSSDFTGFLHYRH